MIFSGSLSNINRAKYGYHLWNIAPLAFAACTVVMILSLPLFPSQDGPLHLYYVDVLRNLLAHTGVYSQYFEIKSYLTPYMLEYYSLLGLEQVFSPLISEKILICAYVLLFILSFRYLLGSVTKEPSPWALTGAIFCLNFYVYMGFINYALGSAFVLLLSGFWLRWMKQLSAMRIAALSVGFILLVFTHPLSPPIFLAFAALYLLLSLLEEWRIRRNLTRQILHNFLAPLCTLACMSVTAFLWTLHFHTSRPLLHSIEKAKTTSLFYRFLTEISFLRIIPIHIGILRFGLICLTLTLAVALIVVLFKNGRSLGAIPISLAVFAFLCFVLSCIAPEEIPAAGAYYLSSRFSIPWVMFLIAAAASAFPSRRIANRVWIAGLVIAAAILPVQWIGLSRTANELSAALNLPLVKPGSKGMLMTDEDAVASDPDIFKPYLWAGAHFFRESQAVLTNAPWTDMKFIMLRPKIHDPWTYEDNLKYVPAEALNGLKTEHEVPVDFVIRFDPDGQHTWALTQRLGFPLQRESPKLAFYARPSSLRTESEQSAPDSDRSTVARPK